MITRAEETGVPWPTLEPSDIGDLVSFLNSQQTFKVMGITGSF